MGHNLQVIYHCTVRTLDGVIVESTRSEYGGEHYGISILHFYLKLVLAFILLYRY